MVNTHSQNIHTHKIRINKSLKAKQKNKENMKIGGACVGKRGTEGVEEVVAGKYDQYILYLYVELSWTI